MAHKIKEKSQVVEMFTFLDNSVSSARTNMDSREINWGFALVGAFVRERKNFSFVSLSEDANTCELKDDLVAEGMTKVLGIFLECGTGDNKQAIIYKCK